MPMRFTQGPRDASDALIERHHFVIAGLILSWSSYSRPVPSASGAPIGIMKSFWIFTKKRAWGYGTVVDWAKLQNLEIKTGPTPPVVSESGRFRLSPPLAVPGDFEVRITNRNAVDALGILRFFEADPAVQFPPWLADQTKPVTPTGDRVAIQIHFAVLQHAQKLLSIRPERPRIITGVECETEPAGGTLRRARIFGRPEWDT